MNIRDATSKDAQPTEKPTKVERYLVIFIMYMASTARIPPISPVSVGDTGPFLDSLRALGYLASLGLILAFHQSWLSGLLHAKAIALLVGVSTVSALWSFSLGSTLKQGVVLVGMTSLSIYIGARYRPPQLLAMIATTTAIIAVMSFVAVVVFPGFGGIEPDGIWRGVFVHKNLLGRTMACGTLAWALIGRYQPRHRLLSAGMFAACFALTLLSNSITSAVVLVLVLASLPLLRAASEGAGRAMVILATVGIFVPILVANFDQIAGPVLSEMGRDTTLTGRTDVWALAIDFIFERPMIGHGFTGFWENEGVRSEFLRRVKWLPAHAHNGYLDLILGVGMVGFVPFLVSLIASAKYAMNYLRENQRTPEGTFPAAFLLFFVLYNSAESITGVQAGYVWILYVSVSVSLALQFRPTPFTDYQYVLKARESGDISNESALDRIESNTNSRTDLHSHEGTRMTQT